MASLKSRLKLALLTQKSKKNIFQQGFTLIELMIVVVIVGILTSIALPSFLNQSTKAKGTEGKSDISSIVKNAAAEFATGGAAFVQTLIGTNGGATSCNGLGGRAAGDTLKFDYTCSLTNNILTITATGDANDSGLTGKTIVNQVDLDTGIVTLVAGTTCQVFGGTLSTGACA